MPSPLTEELTNTGGSSSHSSSRRALFFSTWAAVTLGPCLSAFVKMRPKGIPFGLIFTKADKQGSTVTAAQVEKNKARLLEEWEELPPVFVSSSVSGLGKEEILNYIGTVLQNL